MNGFYTYRASEAEITFLGEKLTGLAEDSFINIQPNGAGFQMQVGTDGQAVRYLDSNTTFTVKVVFFQSSPGCEFLTRKFNIDKKTFENVGEFILRGGSNGFFFRSTRAWVTNRSERAFGKDVSNVSITLSCAGDITYYDKGFMTKEDYINLYDANGDGRFDDGDPMYLLRMSAGLEIKRKDYEFLRKFDFDKDGEIKASDARVLMRKLAEYKEFVAEGVF